jgi:predicted HTH domain antitoxin
MLKQKILFSKEECQSILWDYNTKITEAKLYKKELVLQTKTSDIITIKLYQEPLIDMYLAVELAGASHEAQPEELHAMRIDIDGMYSSMTIKQRYELLLGMEA